MQVIFNGIQHLKEAIADSRKVLLVRDASFPFLSIKDEVNSVLSDAVVFEEFAPNPLYEQVCKGVELFNAQGCDTIVAIGGGSAIDVAKCIKLYCKMVPGQLYLNQPYQDSGVKLVAIPTTAGTGSESTRFAVIYYEGKKQSVTHESIIPNVAILEPSVLKPLPLYQKKCTMLDALCQGMESWWSVNSTDKSKVLSHKAVELVMAHWHAYIFDNTDEAAAQMMTAANLAGQAICITQTTAAHAFSYKVTSIYGIPHGHAVAACLHHIWEYMDNHPEKCIDSRGGDYLAQTFNDISSAMGCQNVPEAIALFRQMLQEMELAQPSSVEKEKEIDILASSVNPVRLKNNPVALDADTISQLYHAIVN